MALLHQLGFKYKKTTVMPSGLNPENQAEFKKIMRSLRVN
ncbi:hypothetical protein DID80_05530 [Candidatus Marinamargulisbacteria bacterium SCGC AAA071-K20]|nr:hypothetical protein DID80_05530 [Candidatus Marinamargulisbacteria bacterium SCGC AAA071-K20]